MKTLSKWEIRRKALRAAAGVALFTGGVGCGGQAPQVDLDGQPVIGEELIDQAGPAFVDVDRTPPRPADLVIVRASCPLPMSEATEAEWTEWEECCAEAGWQADGCTPWGPPAPPRMEVA